MEDSVTQRVRDFLESIHLTVNGLSKVINIGQPTLSKQMKDGGCGVSLTTIVLLLQAYPNLSAEWLLRGEGEMEKGEYKVTKEYIPVRDDELVNALRETISVLKERNAELKEQVTELKREKSYAPVEYDNLAAE